MKIIYNADAKSRYQGEYICLKCKKTRLVKGQSKKILLKHKCICSSCRNKENWNKPVTFKNLFTNKVKSSKSITEFVRSEKNLPPNAKYHFAQILTGKRLHYKGWALNKNYKIDINKIKKITQFIIKPAIIDIKNEK